MLTKITLIVALCSGAKFDTIQSRLAELRKANPGTVVSVRVDKKARCIGKTILTGPEARLAEQLGEAK
jgi:hypothetical protein